MAGGLVVVQGCERGVTAWVDGSSGLGTGTAAWTGARETETANMTVVLG